ncbi:MAG: hypothetical protein ACRC2U_18615, partial [Aeromonas sp.]
RTNALIGGVSALARSQAETEFQILQGINPITDINLAGLVEERLQNAPQQPATMWDLLRSEQTQRLAILKLACDFRAMFAVVLSLLVGMAIGGVSIAILLKGGQPTHGNCTAEAITQDTESRTQPAVPAGHDWAGPTSFNPDPSATGAGDPSI